MINIQYMLMEISVTSLELKSAYRQNNEKYNRKIIIPKYKVKIILKVHYGMLLPSYVVNFYVMVILHNVMMIVHYVMMIVYSY